MVEVLATVTSEYARRGGNKHFFGDCALIKPAMRERFLKKKKKKSHFLKAKLKSMLDSCFSPQVSSNKIKFQ